MRMHDLLLGRRLRTAERRVTRRTRCYITDTAFDERRPADRFRLRRRATPTRRSSRTTTSSSWPPTRTSRSYRPDVLDHERCRTPVQSDRGGVGGGRRRRRCRTGTINGPSSTAATAATRRLPCRERRPAIRPRARRGGDPRAAARARRRRRRTPRTTTSCFPGEKAGNAAEAGWDAVLLVNRHRRRCRRTTPDCGFGRLRPPDPSGVCTTHEALHLHVRRYAGVRGAVRPRTTPGAWRRPGRR